MNRTVACLCAAAALVAGAASALPIDGTFKYQGRLTNGGVPITGLADVRFVLWDAAVGGTQAGPVRTFVNVPVTDGLFTAEVDFGVDAFTGDERWLQIDVRSPAGVGSYTTLGRQEMLGTPYAVQTRGLFVDDTLNVGIGTTSPDASLHVGGSLPSLLVKDTEGGSMASVLVSPGGTWPISTRHSIDGNLSSILAESQWGTIWAAMDREGGGNSGVVAALGSSPHRGDGYLELMSKGTGSSTVRLYADSTPEDDDDESSLLRLSSAGATGSGASLILRNNSGHDTVVLNGGANGAAGSLSVESWESRPSIELQTIWDGGNLKLYENGFGNAIVHAYRDTSAGGGGVLDVMRADSGQVGFSVNGNWAGNEGTKVSISGGGASASFDMTAVGNASVNLPTNALAAHERLDEPGVGSATSNASITMTSAYSTILASTVACPTAGYCVVIGTGQMQANHVTGTVSSCEFGVSGVSGSLPANQDVVLVWPAALPSALYTVPVTVHGTFQVSEGPNTFYFIGHELSGATLVYDSQFTVMFFPTAYGTVQSTVLARDAGDAYAPTVDPMTASDLAAEGAASLAADRARRDRELAAMQAEMWEMRAELEELRDEPNR